MQLLDAFLAFALTLAALATVVTIFMETGLRVLRMRKRNLMELMKLFDRELASGSFRLQVAMRTKFFESVVRNPAGASIAGPYGGGLCKAVTAVLGFLPRLMGSIRKGVSGRVQPDAEQPDTDTNAVIDKLKEYNWCRLGRDVYDKVSLEHVLRRLAENDLVVLGLQTQKDVAKAELDRLARKFEELSSAISADFKRRAQIWSIVLGVVFAVGANVDGFRIINAYIADDRLTQAVISQQATFESAAAEAEERRNMLDALTGEVDAALKAIEDAGGVGDDEQKAALSAALEALAQETSPQAIQESAQRAATAFAGLESLGIPIGWGFYPACPYGSDDKDIWQAAGQRCGRILESIPDCGEEVPSASCRGLHFWTPTEWTFLGRINATVRRDLSGSLQWLVIAVGTGLLIGLGAPFWFDVAKRLSEVRKMFSGSGSAEERMSGKDANGNAEDREDIVGAVVAGATASAGGGAGQQSPAAPSSEP